MDLVNMIEIRDGRIEEFVENHNIDAIVNPARPSLMGGRHDGSVDEAIHTKINEKDGRKNYFKQYIKREFENKFHTEKENIIRCGRGEAVLTKGGSLCKYVIHTVGPKSDRNEGHPNGYSSSCVKKLVSCYENIMSLIFKYPEIEKVAIPVISSGNYGFDFDYAFRIGLVTVYNELLEKKNEYRELFKEINLRKIYFVILNDNGNCDRARNIFDEYQEVFQREHRAVYSKVLRSQKAALKEINMYDEQRGYFTIAKITRLLLIYLRYVFVGWTLLKDFFGKWDWVRRRCVIEIIALVKVIIPILFMCVCGAIKGSLLIQILCSIVILYDLGDTITYLIALMFLSDVQRPSANVIRSLVMLVINYIEVQFDMAAVYLFMSNFIYNKMYTVWRGIGFIIGDCIIINEYGWLQFTNNGIKFFFLTVALSYFSNHMRLRKFRTV
ncbi:macro domain-containing protein [Anaerobutyricum soehngenii]|uniref:macro domain-containing protein n=1 Tax=Anaerobutyricum soehngenii TaxID=105843 RepID=UPI001C1145DF|nr:macro domain-containing protein [Anaerobutyricum soehngenii]MBU5416947.1 macro domain-containing protein [Anaerobutyricum soehngenii]